MSPSDTATPPSENRKKLELRANAIRSRLMRHIDALDARRHEVVAIGRQARALAAPVAVTVIGVAVIVAGAAFAVRHAVVARRERRLGYRFAQAVATMRASKRPSTGSEMGRKIAIAMVTLAANELAKHAARWLEARAAEHPETKPA